jgi:hypothetical protein
MKNAIYLFLFIAITANAEEYNTGGGYDYKAVEEAERQKQLSIERKQAKEAKARKAKQLAIAKQKAQQELLPENTAKLKDHEVCTKAGRATETTSYSIWLQELKRRQLRFNSASIQNKQINIGDSECDIFAVFGKPKRYNRTVNAKGTSVQFVYENTYIYTSNGVITSWQD